MESVVTAHEVVDEVHSSCAKGKVFKVDHAKAYDKVSLDFLYKILSRRGFGGRWVQCIRSITQEGSVGVKINGEEGVFSLLVED